MRIIGYLTIEGTRDALWGPSRFYKFKQTGAEKQFDQQQIEKGKMGITQAGTLAGRSSAEAGTLLPAYQSIIKDPGYSASDKSAITLNTLGGLGASFGGATDAATNRMARTHNSAGYGDTLGELARERGRQTSTAEAGLQEKFADTALSERDKALSGFSNLYGIDTRTMADLMSQQRPTPYRTGPFTQAAANATQKWLSPFGGG